MVKVPFQSAHVPILFESFPVARVAFIPSSSDQNLTDYDPDFELHCGAVDCSGAVHHYTAQLGIQVALSGWENAIVFNVGVELNFKNFKASEWDKSIKIVSDYFSFWTEENRPGIHSNIPINPISDCLDFVTEISNATFSNHRVRREIIAEWLSNYLNALVL